MLATLTAAMVLVPSFAAGAHAQTTSTIPASMSLASLQCGSGGVVTLASATTSPSTTPAGTTTASTTPAGTSAATPSAPDLTSGGTDLTCYPVSDAVEDATGATASLRGCGVITAYMPPVGTAAGTLMFDGFLLSVPAGVPLPASLSVGGAAWASFLIPGGQLISIGPGSCQPRDVVVLKATLASGATGAANGTGTAIVTFFPTEGAVCYQVNVSGITLPAIAEHIHHGAAGVNGPIVIPFATAPDKTGYAAGCVSASPSLIQQIIANPADYYVNVHTTDFPAGAIRGQLG